LRAVNDRLAPVALTVTARALAMDGSARDLGRASVTVTPEAALPVLHLPADALGAGEVLAFAWQEQNGAALGSDIFAPKPWKTYDLRAPEITHSISAAPDGWAIDLSTRNPAFFVALEADQPGRFSRNAFALLPGQDARITFTPEAAGPAPRFTLRDLHSATYGAPLLQET
jgi:beta-mannosidase